MEYYNSISQTELSTSLLLDKIQELKSREGELAKIVVESECPIELGDTKKNLQLAILGENYE